MTSSEFTVLDSDFIIRSVEDAIQIVKDDEASDGSGAPRHRHLNAIYDPSQDTNNDPFYPFPFGIWFRGHDSVDYRLEPSVFRKQPKDKWYDETKMIQHAKLRNPANHEYHTNFDLLCLLQHYNLPTRLLDWTESVLVALYFAVADRKYWGQEGDDGRLYALNASRLNYATRLHDHETRYICAATSIDVVIRTHLANALRKKDLRYTFEKDNSLALIDRINTGTPGWECSGISLFMEWLKNKPIDRDQRDQMLTRLKAPVAVFPNRMNPRMTSQSAMALVFGGKVFPRYMAGDRSLDHIQQDLTNSTPYQLEQLSAEQRDSEFLQSFIVRKEAKENIHKQLTRIGIHEAALFPEIEHVGNYVRNQWIVD